MSIQTWISIDVGILHLAWIQAQVKETDDSWEIVRVQNVRLINISELCCPYAHKRIPYNQCTLPHSKDVCDRVAHLIQEYQEEWNDADHILIERQPLSGLVHVEQLLYHLGRHKAELVSANALHAFFSRKGMVYEQRKQDAISFASFYLKSFAEWNRAGIKQDDLADAYCQLVYVLARRLKERTKKKKQENKWGPVQTGYLTYPYNDDTVIL
jgi:hypothetical protein